MKNLRVENLKYELESMLRVQSLELNRFAEKISENPYYFDSETLRIALRLSGQALAHAVKTEERLREVKCQSLLREVSS
jgi:hypothetical protein